MPSRTVFAPLAEWASPIGDAIIRGTDAGWLPHGPVDEHALAGIIQDALGMPAPEWDAAALERYAIGSFRMLAASIALNAALLEFGAAMSGCALADILLDALDALPNLEVSR